MATIMNLTQHAATPDQIADGVVDLTGQQLAQLKGLLTFSEIPSKEGIEEKAKGIIALATSAGAEAVMIGGAPYLMSALEKAAAEAGVRCGYAFSERVSVEEIQPDGTVLKKNVFRHAGFVWV